MNCERVATTTKTMARITERGDGGGGDDANYRSSVQKRAKKWKSDERWEGNTQQKKKQQNTWLDVMRMMEESVSSLLNQNKAGRRIHRLGGGKMIESVHFALQCQRKERHDTLT